MRHYSITFFKRCSRVKLHQPTPTVYECGYRLSRTDVRIVLSIILLLATTRHRDSDGNDDAEDDEHDGGDDEAHLHVLPPHLVLQLVRAAPEHARLLLQLL